MTEPALDVWLRQLRGFLHADQTRTLTDADLVQRFANHRDELAFGVLLERHGPLVLGVCRRMLGSGPDADDAFQATFLVLVQKARSLTQWGCLANWLHAVACRVAMKSRAQGAKRHRREQPLADAPEPASTPLPNTTELRQVLDQEMAALPTKYRLPLLLCYLEGLSTADAAQQLGWPLGTVSGRMARGRELLGKRLTRRGLVVPAALAPLLVNELATAPLLATTLNAVQQPATVSATITELTNATLRSMRWPRTTVLASIMITMTVVSGLVWAGMQGTTPPPAPEPVAKQANTAPLPDGVLARWGQTLRHANLTMVVPTPDGQHLASAGANGVRLWDRATGKLVRPLLTPDERLTELAISADGKAIAGYGKKAHVWDLATGDKRFTIETGELTRHHRVTFDATSKTLLVIEEKCIRRWDVQTGKAAPEPEHKPSFRLFGDFLHNPVNQQAAIMNCNSPTYLIDLNTGAEMHILHEPRRHLIGAIAYSGDGQTFAGALEATVRIYTPTTGVERRTIKTSLSEVPRKIALSHDGKLLAVLGSNAAKSTHRTPPNMVLLYDTTTGQEQRAISLSPKDNDDQAAPHDISLSADGKTLIGWDSATIYVWDTTTGERLLPEGTWHQVSEVVVSHDGQRWATISDQSEYVRVWDGNGRQQLAVQGRKPHLSPDGSQLLVVNRRHEEVELWDIAQRQRIRTWKPHTNQETDHSNVGRAVFLNDGQQIMTMGSGGIYGLGGTVAYWSIADGKERKRVGPVGDILAWSPDGKQLLAQEPNYASKRYMQKLVWDLQRGEKTDTQDDLQQANIVLRDPAMLSPDGERVAVVDNATGRLGVWNLKNGQRVHTLSENNTWGGRALWSPDGRWLVSTAQHSDVVRIWNASTGQEVRALRPEQGTSPKVAFSGDGRKLLTIGADTTTILWDVEVLTGTQK